MWDLGAPGGSAGPLHETVRLVEARLVATRAWRKHALLSSVI